MGEVFRRCATSMAKILRVNRSHSTSVSQDTSMADEALTPELIRDRQILTASELSAFRRTIIIERQPNESFGFSLQSILINKPNQTSGAGERLTFVSRVSPNSPADLAGIIPGDVLVAIDGDVVIHWSHADLISLIQTKSRMRVIVIFENMAKKVSLISYYNEIAKRIEEKKKQLAVVEQEIEGIISRRRIKDTNNGSQGGASADGCLSYDDSLYSDIASTSRFSIKSAESWSFDEASVQFI